MTLSESNRAAHALPVLLGVKEFWSSGKSRCELRYQFGHYVWRSPAPGDCAVLLICSLKDTAHVRCCLL